MYVWIIFAKYQDASDAYYPAWFHNPAAVNFLVEQSSECLASYS
jgi:hypothetical protein